MTLRSRGPVPALALTTGGAAVVTLLQGDPTLVVVAPLLALYTVALRGDRRTTVLAWAATAVPLTLAGLVGAPGVALSPEALPVLPWTAVVAAVGDGLRSRRAYLAAVEERAERAERSRDEEAGRRVAEERVRIARELHDVVAHHIAVVSVQAGVAQHLLATQPAAASDALVHVRRSAAAVLEELGDILSVLREPGERGEQSEPGDRGDPGERGGPERPSAPAPGLARLDSLVDSFIAAGLAVEWSLHGQPRELAPTVDLVAYRVLEEGLTNAFKHGTGTAYVRVEYGSSSLHLCVLNSVAVPVLAGSRQRADGSTVQTTGRGTGHGLLGMRERAAAVGGTLRAAPASGGTFCVEAELPLRVSAQP